MLGFLAEQTFQKRLALRSQWHLGRKFQLLRKNRLVYFVGISAIERRQSDEQLIEKRTHTVEIDGIGMSNSE